MSSSIQTVKISKSSDDSFVFLTLNRPDKANALTLDMIKKITDDLLKLREAPSERYRALVLSGEGKNFCGGADLSWMQASATLSFEENEAEAKILQQMFEALDEIPFPTFAVVKGSAFGGGVGLAATCDYVLASSTAKFCLSEVRLGLVPSVIMPYVARKLTYSNLLRFAYLGHVFSGEEACKLGFAQISVDEELLQNKTNEELWRLIQGGAQAQRQIKSLYKRLWSRNFKAQEECVKTIAEVRRGPEAQAGFKAFLSKGKPSWQHDLPHVGEWF